MLSRLALNQDHQCGSLLDDQGGAEWIGRGKLKMRQTSHEQEWSGIIYEMQCRLSSEFTWMNGQTRKQGALWGQGDSGRHIAQTKAVRNRLAKSTPLVPFHSRACLSSRLACFPCSKRGPSVRLCFLKGAETLDCSRPRQGRPWSFSLSMFKRKSCSLLDGGYWPNPETLLSLGCVGSWCPLSRLFSRMVFLLLGPVYWLEMGHFGP